MLTAIVAIFIFAVLVIVHEFGHFITAKLAGMYVEEFSIGMGPQLLSKRIGETRYSLRLLPLGGFVRIIGDDPSEEERANIDIPVIPEYRRYQNISVWKRIIFVCAGSFMNFITAILIFAGMYMVMGQAVPVEHPLAEISSLVENGPAMEAGLAPGDKVTSVNGQPITYWEELTAVIDASEADQVIQLEVQRQGETLQIAVTPKFDEASGHMLLGVYNNAVERKPVGPFKGLQMGAIATWQISGAMLDVVGDLFTGKINIADEEEGLTGPIGIVHIIGETTRAGWIYVFNLMALLSINLGLLNILPIPSLDGSKLMFLILEGLRGKPVDPLKENMVHLTGYALIMLLIVYVTYQDIMRFFIK